MKKYVSIFLLLAIILSLMPIIPVSAESGTYTFDASESLVTGNFTTYEENGKTIVSFSDSVNYGESTNLPEKPTLQYSFDCSTSGDYHVWIKAKVKTTGGDSIWTKFGVEETYTRMNLPVNPDSFLWIKTHSGYLNAGINTLEFIPREKQLDIMNICVTADALYIPENQQYYSIPNIQPKEKTHPQLLFNSSDIKKIKSNLTLEDNKVFIDRHTTVLNYTFSVIPLKYDQKYVDYLKSNAFEYAVNNDADKGKIAVSSLSSYLDNLLDLTTLNYAYAGNVVYMSSLVYDWCYNLFKTDSERKAVLSKVINLIHKFTETKWPPLLQNGWTGHGCESSVLRDALALGVAAYDECPDIYNIAAGRIYDEYKDIRTLYYNADKYPFGSSYGLYRGRMDITSMLIFKSLGISNIWESDGFARAPYWFLYATRSDGYYLSEGDTTLNFEDSNTTKQQSASYPYYIMSSLYNDGYLKDAYFKETTPVSDEYLECIIFSNDSVEKKDISELPYSKYFDYPSGQYIARTGWDENSAIVQMKINELDIMEHNHQDAGAFQIYYKGALATDSGYYQSEDASNYSSPHHTAYTRQTIAHNCMLIYDKDESTDNFRYSSANEGVNSGGQFFASKNNTVEFPDTIDELKNDARLNTSKVLAHEHNKNVINPDFTYLKGDLSGAYSDKVSDYERSFMFLNLHDENVPAVLIVFDHVVSSDASFEKTYLLHGVNAPEISGTRTILKRTETHNDYTYNGKLINDTLLPKNPSINPVGENQNEFLVNGENYSSQGKDGCLNEGGGIRTEIKPSTSSKEDYFLNVMQMSDADSEKEPLETTLIESETHTGVKIADRVVLFGKTKQKNDTALFSFTGEGNFKITVTDMNPGRWEIYKDDKYFSTKTVTEEGSVLSFDGAAGKYEIQPAKEVGIYSSEVFYNYLNSYNEENAFIVFSRIYNLPANAEVEDLGFLFADNEENLKNSHSSVKKASAYKELGNRFDEDGKMEFGTIFYGKGIKNFTPYYVRPYVTYKSEDITKTLYGDIRKKVVKNYGQFNDYYISDFEIE